MPPSQSIVADVLDAAHGLDLVGIYAAGPVYRGTFDCIRQIYRASGVRGLYAGWWVTFWRDAPAYAAWFVAYDWTRAALQSGGKLSTNRRKQFKQIPEDKLDRIEAIVTEVLEDNPDPQT